MSDSLLPHESQHTRPPCPSPTPGVYPNSCPLSWWCHPTVSSSAVSFSSCLQSFPALGSFLMGCFFVSGGQSIGASALASVLPMYIQDWFPLELIGLISLQSKGLLRVFSNTTVQKHQFFSAQLSLQSQLTHPYMTTGKTITLTRWTSVSKIMFLLFNMPPRLVIAFLLRSKHLLTSWLLSSCAVILEPKKIWQCQKNVQTTTQLHSFHMLAKWNELKISQSCLTLCDLMDYGIHGILQARILEWVAFPFSRGSSQPRDWTQVSPTAGGFFTSWPTGEDHTSKGMLKILQARLQ